MKISCCAPPSAGRLSTFVLSLWMYAHRDKHSKTNAASILLSGHFRTDRCVEHFTLSPLVILMGLILNCELRDHRQVVHVCPTTITGKACPKYQYSDYWLELITLYTVPSFSTYSLETRTPMAVNTFCTSPLQHGPCTSVFLMFKDRPVRHPSPQ